MVKIHNISKLTKIVHVKYIWSRASLSKILFRKHAFKTYIELYCRSAKQKLFQMFAPVIAIEFLKNLACAFGR